MLSNQLIILCNYQNLIASPEQPSAVHSVTQLSGNLLAFKKTILLFVVMEIERIMQIKYFN